MSKKKSINIAIKLACEKLHEVDFSTRARILGLPAPENGQMKIRAFGQDMILTLKDFFLSNAITEKPAKPSDRLLILHYLKCDLPLPQEEELITFRKLPGGQFYWEPFQARSIKPLLSCIGNNQDLLENKLNRFDWTPVSTGDRGARIHTIGQFHLTLIYRKGDEEFPPSIDLLFPSWTNRIFPTEDAAVLAGRICLGML
jgi:uncharacterized protein DUF3786